MEQVEIKREWKPIEGYESKFEISKDGLIHYFKRRGTENGYTYGSLNSEGYFVFNLNRKPRKAEKVHRLVWETFVGEIPKGYDVHHKNHIRTDNRLENLEIIEHKKHIKRHKEKHIIQYMLNGTFVKEWNSMLDIEKELGFKYQGISAACRKKIKTAYGYIWKYKGED